MVGNPKYYKPCQAMFICGTPLATDAGAPLTMKADLERARKLLKEGGYDGTPVVVMQSTDVAVLNNLAPVAANALKQAGFKVDLQAMDWQTLVSRRAKKEPPSQGGWNVFLTNWVAADVLNPIMAAAYATSCDKAWFGWPCDEKMEKLRDAFARETDPQKQKQIAEQIQVYALEFGTHAICGQWSIPTAWRKDRFGGLLQGPAPFFWNIAKK